jgi:predicted transcriptional regulator
VQTLVAFPLHPVMAPAYSAPRSAMGKQIVLGSRRIPLKPPAAPKQRQRTQPASEN